MDKIRKGIDLACASLGDTHEHWTNASKSVMTTDTVNKLVTQEFSLPNSDKSFIIAGIAKGAGMIHPNMATMLSLVCTDAAINAPLLQQAVKYAVDRSFNNISVDGDTSTNDTFAVLANGQSGIDEITDSKSEEYLAFRAALTKVSANLAKQLIADGEGATKFVSVTVAGASTFQQARTIASSISKSALVKTALFGQDANWGRILCAVGYAGEEIKPDSKYDCFALATTYQYTSHTLHTHTNIAETHIHTYSSPHIHTQHHVHVSYRV
jgi:glutamate N-acetyltransferase/amino-acid N-acetyltransferase